MPEEETARPSLATRLKGHMKRAPFICKFVELVLCIVSTGLVIEPFNKIRQDMNHVGLFHVGVCGYILINAIIILGHLLGDKLPKNTAIIFSGLGAVLCCSGGLVLIHNRPNNLDPNSLTFEHMYGYSDQMISSGFFAILAAVVFIVDAYLTNKYE